MPALLGMCDISSLQNESLANKHLILISQSIQKMLKPPHVSAPIVKHKQLKHSLHDLKKKKKLRKKAGFRHKAAATAKTNSKKNNFPSIKTLKAATVLGL